MATANRRNVPMASQSTAALLRGGSGRFGVWVIKALRPGRVPRAPSNYSFSSYSFPFSLLGQPILPSIAAFSIRPVTSFSEPIVTKVVARQASSVGPEPAKSQKNNRLNNMRPQPVVFPVGYKYQSYRRGNPSSLTICVNGTESPSAPPPQRYGFVAVHFFPIRHCRSEESAICLKGWVTFSSKRRSLPR